MSFNIQRLPDQPEDNRLKEVQSLYVWAFAYCALSIGFDIGGWIMIFSHHKGLGLLTILLGWIPWIQGRRYKKEADRII